MGALRYMRICLKLGCMRFVSKLSIDVINILVTVIVSVLVLSYLLPGYWWFSISVFVFIFVYVFVLVFALVYLPYGYWCYQHLSICGLRFDAGLLSHLLLQAPTDIWGHVHPPNKWGKLGSAEYNGNKV